MLRSDFVRCPICLGDKFLQDGPFGVVPIAAFDLTSARARGVQTWGCYACEGNGVVTQRESDLVTIEVMHRDLLLHRVLSR